jgi:hypothetical protein
LGGVRLSAELMEHGSKMQCKTQAKGMRQLVRQRQRLLAALQGLPRRAQQPQDMGHKAPGNDPRVNAIDKGMGAVLLGMVEGNRLRTVRSGGCQLAEKKCQCS